MFQSEGLIHGMFQRLESMRGHAFGIVGLFGRSRGAQIQGFWIWKGKELLFETNPQWQVRFSLRNWFIESVFYVVNKKTTKTNDLFIGGFRKLRMVSTLNRGKQNQRNGQRVFPPQGRPNEIQTLSCRNSHGRHDALLG